MGKYSMQGSEGYYQAGSNEQVLANKLAITLAEEINEAETHLLSLLYKQVLSSREIEKLSVSDILAWHRIWLGEIYSWAGQLRTVNMSKEGFSFCAANFIEPQLDNFQHNYLKYFPDLNSMSEAELVSFLAKSHVEFILIHPFREGNGRVSRLLLDVMVCAAGYAPLDYSLWKKHKQYYFKSIQAGAGDDYKYIEKLVKDVLIT